MSAAPYLTLAELQALFGYKTPQCIRRAIITGIFPLPTYKVCRRIVADREVVRQFFLQQRELGLAAIKKQHPGTERKGSDAT